MADNPFADLELLERIAARVGTPFFLYDAAVLRDRIERIRTLTDAEGLQARYAMKALSLRPVLDEMRRGGIWIDAVSGNEVLRAGRSGFAMGANPPEVMLTADVFRDNALAVVGQEAVLPNIGSPGQLAELVEAGYRGPIGIRVNPGFGHGHVAACDTGGPSSKHGIWIDDLDAMAEAARAAQVSVVLLHAHVGSGPQIAELEENLERLAGFFAEMVGRFPALEAVNLGGGFPHDYRTADTVADLAGLGRILRAAQPRFSQLAGRSIRVEVEPGRFFVASCGVVVSRITDRKQTRTNAKGEGYDFLMVDAGFCDLVRPAMYGAHHRISVVGRALGEERPFAVAGPLCESGDLFTRDAEELIEPRLLPTPAAGDFLVLHDAGAYGTVLASNYNSLGRAPQVWLDGGKATIVQRRETLEDILALECQESI
ncbi:MAG: diaminopimelate decarboxylase [Deltaproteobacteria bacterium]